MSSHKPPKTWLKTHNALILDPDFKWPAMGLDGCCIVFRQTGRIALYVDGHAREIPQVAIPFDPEWLAPLRFQLHITQAAFAKRFGVCVATLSRWENGHYPVPPEHIEEMRRLFFRDAVPVPLDVAPVEPGSRSPESL